MPVGKHTNPTIKLEVINKIRNEGMSVTDASEQYNVNAKTIYRWLKEGVINSDRNLIP